MMCLAKRIRYALVAAMLVLPVCSHAGQPSDELKATIDSILDVLKDQSIAQDDRNDILLPIIEARFDFRSMARLVLSVNWRRANSDQQDRFVNLFRRLVESSYLGRLDQYSDQRIILLAEKKRGKKFLVRTVIINDGIDIPIDYKMHRSENEWRIYDVQIEGVSMVRNYRDSYRKIVRREGLDGLMIRMEKKIRVLQQEDV